MRFRLAPRSMTLDDLELVNNLFSSFRRQYLANSKHRYRGLPLRQLGFLVHIQDGPKVKDLNDILASVFEVSRNHDHAVSTFGQC